MRLTEERQPITIEAYGLGGTWGMSTLADGTRIGEGALGDQDLLNIQTEAGLFQISLRDPNAGSKIMTIHWQIAEKLYQLFRNISVNDAPPIVDTIGQWCTNDSGESIGRFIEGKLLTLFSGDSSHLRAWLAAPMAMNLFERIRQNPSMPRLLGLGTDCADIICPFIDAFVFDTDVAPILITGANHPHTALNSDAPKNFMAAAKLLQHQLPLGVYYVFGDGKHIFLGSDLIKFDPSEHMKNGIAGQTTFVAPHGTSRTVDDVLSHDADRMRAPLRLDLRPDHVLHRLTLKQLHNAMTSILVLNLGDQNSDKILLRQICDPMVQVIVVAGHGLGNADNPMRHYLVEAAKNGKKVIVVSRCLIGKTSAQYDASLLSANKPSSASSFIDGKTLSPFSARAIAIRGVVEDRDVRGMQELVDAWLEQRMRKKYQ